MVMNFNSETLLATKPNSWWINQVLYSRNSKGLSLLCCLDKSLCTLEKDRKNKKVLLKKANGLKRKGCRTFIENENISIKNLTVYEHEQRRQVWDLFCEIITLLFLLEEGYENINIIDEGQNKQPEFTATLNKRKYCIEVKNIHTPRDEENNLTMTGWYSSDVDTNYKTGLEKKIREKCNDANKKFENYIEEGYRTILILFFNHSISSGLTDGFQNDLKKLIDLSNIKGDYNNISDIKELDMDSARKGLI